MWRTEFVEVAVSELEVGDLRGQELHPLSVRRQSLVKTREERDGEGVPAASRVSDRIK